MTLRPPPRIVRDIPDDPPPPPPLKVRFSAFVKRLRKRFETFVVSRRPVRPLRYVELPLEVIDPALRSYVEFTLSTAIMILRPAAPRPVIRWMIRADTRTARRWSELVHEHGREVAGSVYTDRPGEIWLNPDAPNRVERLVGHEMEHIDQLHRYGPAPTSIVPALEDAADEAGRLVYEAMKH